jgi:hypothetical protein
VLIESEFGQPKILLFDRSPTGNKSSNSIGKIATYPMSPGIPANSPESDPQISSIHYSPSLLKTEIFVSSTYHPLQIAFNKQEKELVILDMQELTVGSHDPFTFRGQMTFLEGTHHLTSLWLIE